MEEKLQKLYEQCIQELNSIGIYFENEEIKIMIAKRNNKRYGCCKPQIPDEHYKIVTKTGFRYFIQYQHYLSYTIEISKWVMELEETIIKNTIIHELIHCLPYCNNHGNQFKYFAHIINQKLGYTITRVGNKKEDFEKSNRKFEEHEAYKYKIQCEKCGQIFYRKRLVKNFTRKYRCSKCLGKLKIIEN